MENAVTRVAVLGLNSQIGAQQLARLLIADPLGDKEEWEGTLEKSPEEGAVLLRYEGSPSSVLATAGHFTNSLQLW